MKIHLISILIIMALQSCRAQVKSSIDYIITNDYLSERNLSMMGGPMPSGYNKGLVEGLENSFIEKYENNNIISKKFYNKIGALYYSEQNRYDGKDRLVKTFQIDEFTNDTCIIERIYTDSLKFLTHRKITNLCNNERFDLYYKYNEKGEKIEDRIIINDSLSSRKIIQRISKNEKQIKSYDKENRLSTFLYRYNEKDLLTYEKNQEWLYMGDGEYAQTTEENEYLYKYDEQGNWIERTKQTYLPIKKDSLVKSKHANGNDPPIIKEITSINSEGGVKEKLVRKIYYQ